MAGFRVDAKQLLDNLEKSETKAQIAIKMYATEGAKKMENYAKANRPWTDRTGHARQRLTGWVETAPNSTKVHIGHGVKYGIYLELCNQKRFAILQKTVNACAAEILEGFRDLVKRMRP